MWPEIHGLEVAERPGEEDLPPLEIPAWLSLDLHGRSERSTFLNCSAARQRTETGNCDFDNGDDK